MKRDIEYILNFATGLGREMLLAGASIERTTDTIYRVCASYSVLEPNLYCMSNTIILSALDVNGGHYTSHVQVNGTGTNMARLNSLNQLSRTVCSEKPAPFTLGSMLKKAEKTEDYPDWLLIVGYCIALACICRMFGGGIGEIIGVLISTVIMYELIAVLTKQGVNRIVKDALCMFAAGCLAIVYVLLGLSDDFYTIVLTNAFMMIPGIQMVNAVRNILCGNEANGLVELFKVFLETVAIVLGIVFSMVVFGGALTW